MPVKGTAASGNEEQENGKNNDPTYWRKWYWGVMVFLIAQVIFYYLITQHFK